MIGIVAISVAVAVILAFTVSIILDKKISCIFTFGTLSDCNNKEPFQKKEEVIETRSCSSEL
jgi:hypothetical protein